MMIIPEITSYDLTRLRQITQGNVVLSGWAAQRLIDAGLLMPRGKAYGVTAAGWAALAKQALANKGAP